MRPTTLLPLVIPLAWLVPNHYRPWPTAWQDGLVMMLAAAWALTVAGDKRIARPWVAFVAVALVSIAGQAASGRIYFGGDAVLAALYLAAFAVAMGLGYTMPERDTDGLEFGPLPALALGIVIAALLSVGIAFMQWTEARPLGIWTVEMRPGGRPFGNVAQPNHLCSIAFLGLVSAGLLRQLGRIGTTGFWFAACWMTLGMVASGSRTGWLQTLLLIVLSLAMGPRVGLCLSRRGTTVLGVVFAAGVAAWPALNASVGLSEGRSLDETAQGGTRLLHWSTLADAVSREPWFGYGWQQVGVAQVQTAEHHPFVGEQIEYSHNVVLDLLIWTGVPLGLLLAGLATYWLLSRIATLRRPTSAWLLFGAVGLGAHGLVEYPLAYAYFLVPLGLMVGAVERLEREVTGWRVPQRAWQLAAGGLAILLGSIAQEYLQVEQAHRALRLESARIGVSKLTTPPPELRLLTQQSAFLNFAHTPPRAGMNDSELDWMRKVAERFAYPPTMYRYAWASALNGRPEVAVMTIRRLCRIHPVERCVEARAAWSELRVRDPQVPPFPPDVTN